MTDGRVTKAVILDMDGTLCDVSSIRYHVNLDDPRNTGEKRFDRFHAASVDCPPNQQALTCYRWSKNNGFAILIATGRMEEWKYHTITWLQENEIEYDELYMRPQGDYRKDVTIKTEIYDRILEDGYEPIFAIDDNPSIIGLWKSKGLEVVKIPGWEE